MHVLRKLLKYDMKAVFSLWWIGAVVSLVLGIMGGLFCKLYSYLESLEYIYADGSTYWLFPEMFSIPASLAGALCITLTFLLFFLSILWVNRNFYKKFFTDEGYLTFTLPVSKKTLLLSKTINAIIWFCLQGLVTFISNLLGWLIVDSSRVAKLFGALFSFIREAWDMFGIFEIIYALEFIVGLFLSVVFFISLIHFCIAFGAIFGKRTRLLLSLGLFFLISTTLFLVTQIALYASLILMASGAWDFLFLHQTATPLCFSAALLFLAFVAIRGTLAATFYSATQHLLDRKLNLA